MSNVPAGFSNREFAREVNDFLRRRKKKPYWLAKQCKPPMSFPTIYKMLNDPTRDIRLSTIRRIREVMARYV